MTTRFTLRQLEYLVAVAEAGSVSGGAQRMNVSAPSVSAAISSLEAELGLQLFVRRHAQGLSLTPAGQRICDEARDILDRAGGLADIAQDIGGSLRGPVSLGCLTTLAPVLGPRHKAGFESAHPQAQVQLRVAHQAELLAMLDRAEIDLCLTYDMDLPLDVEFLPLADLPPQVMLPAGHPLAAEPRVELAKLITIPMVLLDLPFSRDYFLGLFAARGLRPRIGDRVQDLEMMRGLVAWGQGYGLVNIASARNSAADGRPLALRPLADEAQPARLGLAGKRATFRPRVVEAFIAHMRAAARAGKLP